MDYEDDSEDDGGNGHDYSAPMADPVLIALELCKLANNKTVAAAIRKLCKLDRQYADIQAKCAALSTHAEETKAALDARAAEVAARETEIARREDEFAASIEEARAHLRGYYNSIAEADRHLRYRVLNHADMLHGYNSQLQELPDWPAIRRLVVGLPPDPPPLERDVSYPRIDALSDTFSDPNADRHGNVFLGTLSRDVSHKGAA
jgi:hypothetical protein